MTLQVALVGSDGFVMASDRRATFFKPSRYSTPTRKFAVSDETGIVCAYSGDEFAAEVASHLIRVPIPTEATVEELCSVLKTASDAAWRAHVPKNRSGGPASNQQPLVLVGLIRCKEWPLWRIVVKESSECVSMEQKAFAGDCISGATFFAEAFYSEGPLLPVHELLLLAVHTIREGHRLNRNFVSEEFDLVVCKDGKLEDVDARQLEELIRKSNELHGYLESQVLSSGARGLS